MRATAWCLGMVCVTSLSANAQPACTVEPQTWLNDGGWIGTGSHVTCDFATGYNRLLVELRPLAGTFGGPGSFTAELDRGGPTNFAFSHVAQYSLRASGILADGGLGEGPSEERTVIADVVAPTLLGVPLISEIDGGTFRVTHTGSTDDGEGQVQYESSYRLATQLARGIETELQHVFQPDRRGDLGPGTWVVRVAALDVVRNYGGDQVSAPFTIVEDTSVSPPTPPVPVRPLFGDTSVAFTVFEANTVYHFLGVLPDGGVFAGPVDRRVVTTAPAVVYGYLPAECSFRVMASQLVGGRASPWSAPSPSFMVDLDPPTAPSAPVVTELNGALEVSWGASTDTCSGVKDYRVERSDGVQWQTVGDSDAGTHLIDTPPDAGTWKYRVSALDVADHRSGAVETLSVTWPMVADAGHDAGVGTGDAGVATGDAGFAHQDAGVAGEQLLDVQCGCGTAAVPSGLTAVLVWLWLRALISRRARRT